MNFSIKRTIVSLIVIAVLMGAFIAFGGWTSFSNSTIWFGESKTTVGRIIEVFPSEKVKTYSRRVKYVYNVNGKSFIDFKKLGTQDKRQVIGNSVRVKYLPGNPKQNKVEKLFNDHRPSKGLKYYSIVDDGYIELKVNNGIFRYKRYVAKGEIEYELIGECVFKNDTLFMSHFKFDEDRIENVPEFYVADQHKENRIIEYPENRNFTRVRLK